MATKKSKVKVEEKEKKLFPKMNWYLEQLPGCCGIGVIADIKEEGGRWMYNGRFGGERMRPAEKLFTTKKEQAASLYKEILEKTNSGGWDGDFFSQLLISLVSNYANPQNGHQAGDHQYKELQDFLLKEGWTIYSVFINPNHGNEVTLFGKYFADRTVHPDDVENGEEDDWNDDDDE